MEIIPQNDFRRKKFNKHLFYTAPSPKRIRLEKASAEKR